MAGIVLIVAGLLFLILPKKTFFGQLPGDIYISRDKFTFYFPIVTCILISVVLSLIFYIVNYWRK